MDETNTPMTLPEKAFFGLIFAGIAVYSKWMFNEDKKFEAEAKAKRLAEEAEQQQRWENEREARAVIATIRGIYDNLNNMIVLSVSPESPNKTQRRQEQLDMLSQAITRLEELKPVVGMQVFSEISYALTTARYAEQELAEIS